MKQPGSDEISQGMDRRRFPLADQLISFWNDQRPGRQRGLIAAGCAAVLVIAAVATAVVASRPAYPHAWCGPLLTDLHVQGRSDLGYAAAVARLGRREHAPVGRLVSELRSLAVARSGVQSPDNGRSPSGSIVGMESIFTALRGDLRVLNRSCGQPAGAYQSDSF
jgi:hypothetical protein